MYRNEKRRDPGLKWLDIDFRRKIITILKTKNRKKREFSKEVRLF